VSTGAGFLSGDESGRLAKVVFEEFTKLDKQGA